LTKIWVIFNGDLEPKKKLRGLLPYAGLFSPKKKKAKVGCCESKKANGARSGNLKVVIFVMEARVKGRHKSYNRGQKVSQKRWK